MNRITKKRREKRKNLFKQENKSRSFFRKHGGIIDADSLGTKDAELIVLILEISLLFLNSFKLFADFSFWESSCLL